MKVSIWLDDERACPSDFNCHVYTAKQAIDKIVEANGNIEKVSLDHDLGFYNGDGYQVACFIEKAAHENQLEPFDCYIHTANPVGRMQIFAALLSAARAWYENTGREVVVRIAPAGG